MKRIPRRIFIAEFKREVIKLVTEQGVATDEASRKLDIATKSSRTCMDQLECGKLKVARYFIFAIIIGTTETG